MSDILASSRTQKLHLQRQILGPFFRITAKSLESQNELGRAEGLEPVRYGFDSGCSTAQLLAINDSDLYHAKVLQKDWVVHAVTGSTIGDLAHLLVWGAVGTRMDANVEDLLIKWCTRFK
ncbi:hypothetical protein Ddye_003450 [Dipteronia dyeriana]|uniref:Uncharacterized protein n=1 Tax=Dipteronia dyeriana TaxID=168575 RepID=A0AAD9XS84_9ROSI|nr:hypothetical protein Ddye_003450 [Dipteronia dyeriana]